MLMHAAGCSIEGEAADDSVDIGEADAIPGRKMSLKICYHHDLSNFVIWNLLWGCDSEQILLSDFLTMRCLSLRIGEAQVDRFNLPRPLYYIWPRQTKDC